MRVILLFLLLLEFGFAKKVALVIANSNYAKGYLANPINDAKLIRDILRDDLKFDVTYKYDLTKHEMEEAVRDFSSSIGANDIALFYYAGHGMQYDRLNYLIPLKANAVTEGQIPSVGVDVGYILGGMDRAKLAIVLLDACRNNPFSRSFSRGGTRGLAQVSSNQKNYIISYATEAGAETQDGNGANSPYALALNAFLTQPYEIATLLKKVKNRVATTTNPVQIPYVDDRYVGEFTLTQGNMFCSKVVKVPPTYKSELVSESYERLTWTPTSYKNVKERILSSPGYRTYEWEENGEKKTLKPELKEVVLKVIAAEASSKIQLNETRTSAKTIRIPPIYKTVTVKRVKKEIQLHELPSNDVKSIYVPPHYKAITKRVVVTPPSTKKLIVPAKYKRVLVTPETQKTVSVPCSELN